MKKKKECNVIKPNDIAEARCVMNKYFLDLLDIAMQKVAEEEDVPDADNLDYEIDVKEYVDKFNFNFSKDVYRKLKKSVHNTMKKDSLLTVDLGDGTIADFFVFQEVDYIEKENKIRIVFSRRFKQILVKMLEEKGKKIYYALPDTLQMGSEYSKKLYPILLERVFKDDSTRISFTGSGTLHGISFDRIFEINNFKELLSIPKSYKFSNIKQVCQNVVNEIEKYTPYHAEVFFNEATNGVGRKPVTHICWKMQKKKDIEEKDSEQTVAEEFDIKEYKSLITEYAEDNEIDITLKNIKEIASDAIEKKRNIDEVKKLLYAAHDYSRSHTIKNQVAFLRYMMRHGEPPVSTKMAKEVSAKGKEVKTDYNQMVMDELLAELEEKDSEN